MNFGSAFEKVKQGKGMRLPHWGNDVVIRAKYPNEKDGLISAPYLYVKSRYGVVPWHETTVELFSDDWIVVE